MRMIWMILSAVSSLATLEMKSMLDTAPFQMADPPEYKTSPTRYRQLGRTDTVLRRKA